MKLLKNLRSSFTDAKSIPLLREIEIKSTGDTSDEYVTKICYDILQRKVELANTYLKKSKYRSFFENELFLANTLIHSIFASEYEIILSNDKIGLEKKIKKSL
jgi:hypothetical protein